MHEELCDYDDFGFMSFRVYLEELLNNDHNYDLKETLYKKSHTALEQELGFKKKLRKINNYCSWFTYDHFLTFEIRRVEDSLDYVVEFEMPDPYKVSFDYDDELIFKGSLLVSKEVLIKFYHEL